MKSGFNMRKKLLLILGIIAATALALFVGACSSGADVDAIIKEYPITVIFDYNGGKTGESETQRIQCKMNSLLPKPGATSFFSEPELAGYEVGSYWKGTRGKDGEINLEREWNFDTDRVTENMTLFVIWQREKAIDIVYGENNSQTYSFRILESATSSNVFNRADLEIIAPKWTNHSFYAYYYDEDYTEEVKYPYDYSANPVDKLYAKYIEGNWKIVKGISDLTGISANTNVWLDATLDLSSYRNNNVFPANYSGEFNGRGNQIIGYSFTKSTSRGTLNSNAGLFGTITSTAYIHDVKFVDLSLTVNFNETSDDGAINNIGLLAAVVQDGARIEDVTVGGTIQFDASKSKRAIACNGVYGTFKGTGNFYDRYPTLINQVTINQ